MRHYNHLGAEERDRMAGTCARHEGVSAIAAAVGRNKSTAGGEIAGNGRDGRHGAVAAQSRSDARHEARGPRRRLPDPARAAEARRRIVDDRRSPEQTGGRSRLERGGRRAAGLSTVYRAVSAGEADPPRAAPAGRVRGREEARGSAEVAKAEARALAGRPPETATPDGGREFANRREAGGALGGVPSCFCRPRHPWQRPTVGNANGLVRGFFPKGTDFSRVTDEEARGAFEKINDRPRKALGFRTANEVYREILHSA